LDSCSIGVTSDRGSLLVPRSLGFGNAAPSGRYDEQTRRRILNELIERYTDFSMADYLGAVDHSVSRAKVLSKLVGMSTQRPVKSVASGVDKAGIFATATGACALAGHHARPHAISTSASIFVHGTPANDAIAVGQGRRSGHIAFLALVNTGASRQIGVSIVFIAVEQVLGCTAPRRAFDAEVTGRR
jgi:hypothetical protein